MSDILIRGIEMPKDRGIYIAIDIDGQIYTNQLDALKWQPLEQKAIFVPPHGRLIDADALEYEEAYLNGHYELGDVEIVTREDIESAPTIIPAQEGEI